MGHTIISHEVRSGLPLRVFEIEHLQQREVVQSTGVQLFHMVEKFNEVNIRPGQLVANEIILSMDL